MIDTKALREKILDLAIRGKLVPQDPNDEPASVLLERIRAQKQQMVKEGKLKAKDIKNDTIIFKGEDNLHYEQFQDGTVKCIEDEIPFEIPESWTWVRLGELAQYKKGPFGSSITKSMFVPDSTSAIKVYEQKNAINKDAALGNYFISEEKYESLKSFEIFPNDIIVSCAGTIGETYVMPETMRKGIINQALMKISLYDLRMIDFYLIYFDCQLKSATREQGYGVALKNIPPFDVLKKYLVPIPPIKEQARIVDSVNNLLGTVDDINTISDELNDLIANAKSKILDLAIRGKLVPQDPNDEPASVLLERIRAEKEDLIKQGKIKRDKKESIIFKGEDNSYYEKIGDSVTCIDDELPFEIPNNWAWSRLSSFTEIVMGSSPKGEDICIDNSFTEFHQGKIYFSKQYINCSTLYTKNISKLASKNSVLLCVRAPVGEVNITNRDICIGRGLSSILPLDDIDSIFLFYWLKTCKNEFINKATGSTFSAITSDIVKNILLPVPPLNEQNKIVRTITDMFDYLEHIEASLN